MYKKCEYCNANLDIGESCTCHLEDKEIYFRSNDFVCKPAPKGEIFIENINTSESLKLSKSKVSALKRYSGIYKEDYLCRCLEKKLKSISDGILELRVSIGSLAI